MVNRIKHALGEPDELQPPGDYWIVSSEYGSFYVSPETARWLERVLDRLWKPRWVKFADLNGSRIRLRSAGIESVYESTEAQRTKDRAFHYMRRKEEKADRRWNDDENW